VDFFSDANLVYSENSLEQTYRTQTTSYFVTEAIDNIYSKTFINFSNIKEVYKRQYKKVQDILASTGGFIKIISLVFINLYKFFMKPFLFEFYFQKFLDKVSKLSTDKRENVKLNCYLEMKTPPAKDSAISLSVGSEFTKSKYNAIYNKANLKYQQLDFLSVLKCFKPHNKRLTRFQYLLSKRLNPFSIIRTSYLCDVLNFAMFKNNSKEVKYLAVTNIIDDVFLDNKKEKRRLFDKLEVKDNFNPKETYMNMFKKETLL
jgi:hypothetical protein